MRSTITICNTWNTFFWVKTPSGRANKPIPTRLPQPADFTLMPTLVVPAFGKQIGSRLLKDWFSFKIAKVYILRKREREKNRWLFKLFFKFKLWCFSKLYLNLEVFNGICNVGLCNILIKCSVNLEDVMDAKMDGDCFEVINLI